MSDSTLYFVRGRRRRAFAWRAPAAERARPPAERGPGGGGARVRRGTGGGVGP